MLGKRRLDLNLPSNELQNIKASDQKAQKPRLGRGPGGSKGPLMAYMLPDSAAPGLNHRSRVFSEKTCNVVVLINSALLSVSRQLSS